MSNPEKNINKLQLLEQNIQQYSAQKQQFQMQLIEVESALDELEGTDEAFKIIGNIMVKSSKEDLLEDLNKKKEMFELRIKTLDKQEAKLKEKIKDLQEDVMTELQGDKDGSGSKPSKHN